MLKENKMTTILFIVIFSFLIGLLIYTPFYLKKYNTFLEKQHEEEKITKEETLGNDSIENIEDNQQSNKGTIIKEEVEEEMEELEEINLELTIEVNGKKYPATLEDNPTTRAFVKMLPLEITMLEFNGNEKYYELSEKIPSNPISVKKINKGDLMLYKDNTIVLFYDSFDTIYEYTKIGNISDKDNGMLKTNLGTKSSKVKFYQ